jgi:hypothetical protein
MDMGLRKLIFHKLNIVLAVLAAAACLLVPLAPGTPVSAAAPDSVQLTLGATAYSGWEIGPLVPGQSGEQKASIKNTGTRAGSLRVWLSNVAGVEGTPEEFVDGAPSPNGDLISALLLQLSAPGISSSFTMPATVDKFPTSYSSVNYVTIRQIGPGQTETLTWLWQLPAETGNAVQGDSLSFDITYSLVEIPAPGGFGGGGGGGGTNATPTPTAAPATTPVSPVSTVPAATATTPVPASTPAPDRLMELDLPGSSFSAKVSEAGVLADTLAALSSDRVFSLTIDSGTTLKVSNEGRPDNVPVEKIGATVPARIVVAMKDAAGEPALPDGWTRVSPFFDINGITNGYTHGVQMDRPAHMVILYDNNLLPENVNGLATFYYSYQYGWTQLAPPEGVTAEAGQTAADTDHFSLFVVLARNGAGTKPPAHFEVNHLTLSPSRITIDQSSDVKLRVTNTGGMAGDYTVVVKVNGKTQKTQSVSLGPGESREIHLILAPGVSGIYTVESADNSASLIVEPEAQPDVAENSYWWLLFIAMGIALLVLALFRRKRRDPKDSE